MNSKPTVYIVDDDAAVRDGLSLLIESAGLDLKVETFASGAEFLASPPPTQAHACLILDVRMPNMTGPELQAELAQQGVNLPIIFLTGYGAIPIVVQTIQAGAFDFLTKPVDPQQLLDKVQAAIASSASKQQADLMADPSTDLLKTLTKRQREVLMLALKGHPNKHIAKLLKISFRTVEHHRSSILLKTGVSNLLELSSLVDTDDQPEPPG